MKIQTLAEVPTRYDEIRNVRHPRRGPGKMNNDAPGYDLDLRMLDEARDSNITSIPPDIVAPMVARLLRRIHQAPVEVSRFGSSI